jgi:hypothetical protein
MQCDCISKTDKELAAKNLHLDGYALMTSNWKNRITIATAWTDKAKVSKREQKSPPPMLAAFCPFCGAPAL